MFQPANEGSFFQEGSNPFEEVGSNHNDYLKGAKCWNERQEQGEWKTH